LRGSAFQRPRQSVVQGSDAIPGKDRLPRSQKSLPRNDKFMNIVFLGPPGSGKGTQAQRLAASNGLVHLSTGDLFREAISHQTPLGVQIKAFVDSGKLVPDTLVSEVVFEKLRKSAPGAGILLDGYPRTLDQSHALDTFGEREKFQLDAVIFFDVDSAALVKRLSARRQCSRCKEVYNLETRKPRVENICDVCGGELMQRPDDKAEVVQERLKIYDRQTAPILDHYKAKKNFFRIDASRPIDEVNSQVMAVLKQGSLKPS